MADSTCRWESMGCKFDGTDKCAVCFTFNLYYKAAQQKKKAVLKVRAQKADKRQGSAFEAANHQKNVQQLKQTESSMTINSGATRRQKGDENITGYVRVMEELKTQMPGRKGGTKSFTIQRVWLNKLRQEALQYGEEFWYLVFAFSEDEGVNPAGDTFVVSEKDMIFSMIQTVISDRRRADIASQQLIAAEKETAFVKAENAMLLSKIELLEAKLSLAESKAADSGPFGHPVTKNGGEDKKCRKED